MNDIIRNIPSGEVDIEHLADIRDVKIDTSQPRSKRIKSYLRQIRNPRLYLYGDTVVRLSFASSGATLEERLRQYLLSAQGLR